MKYRCPTTYFTIGVHKNHVRYFELNNVALLIGIPKTSDISYYDDQKSVNTKEHHYFLWLPNHPRYKKYKYTDISYLPDFYFSLQKLREILDFELLEKNQAMLDDFGDAQ